MNCARWDLCGGHRATGIPTAILGHNQTLGCVAQIAPERTSKKRDPDSLIGKKTREATSSPEVNATTPALQLRNHSLWEMLPIR